MKKLTPIQSIRKKCLECQGNRYSLVRKCEEIECPLYLYRLGRRPSLKDGRRVSKLCR